MERSRRIFFLLILNLSLVFLSIYILDFLQIVDYRQIIGKVPGLKLAYEAKVENPFLLEKMELNKKWQILNEKMKILEEQKIELEKQKEKIALERKKVADEKKQIQNRITEFEKQKQEEKTYTKRVDQVASQIENMPPQSAVKVLSKQDDMMIIDILNRLEKRANDAGTTSMVSYLLSLMDPEQAARVQRKMLQ